MTPVPEDGKYEEEDIEETTKMMIDDETTESPEDQNTDEGDDVEEESLGVRCLPEEVEDDVCEKESKSWCEKQSCPDGHKGQCQSKNDATHGENECCMRHVCEEESFLPEEQVEEEETTEDIEEPPVATDGYEGEPGPDDAVIDEDETTEDGEDGGVTDSTGPLESETEDSTGDGTEENDENTEETTKGENGESPYENGDDITEDPENAMEPDEGADTTESSDGADGAGGEKYEGEDITEEGVSDNIDGGDNEPSTVDGEEEITPDDIPGDIKKGETIVHYYYRGVSDLTDPLRPHHCDPSPLCRVSQ